jgi:hypothetical protein
MVDRLPDDDEAYVLPVKSEGLTSSRNGSASASTADSVVRWMWVKMVKMVMRAWKMRTAMRLKRPAKVEVRSLLLLQLLRLLRLLRLLLHPLLPGESAQNVSSHRSTLVLRVASLANV